MLKFVVYPEHTFKTGDTKDFKKIGQLYTTDIVKAAVLYPPKVSESVAVKFQVPMFPPSVGAI